MARRSELAWVLARIEEARDKFPSDTDLIPKKMKEDFSVVLDCIAIVARSEAAERSESGEGAEDDE